MKTFETITTAQLLDRYRDIPSPTKHITEPLTWEICLKYEPKLNNILRRIEAIKDANEKRNGTRKLRHNYGLDCWHGFKGHRAIKSDLNDLIGWNSTAEYAELRGMDAYEICRRHLMELLTS